MRISNELEMFLYLGDEADAKRLIENGANVKLSDENGWLPIFYASEKGFFFQIFSQFRLDTLIDTIFGLF